MVEKVVNGSQVLKRSQCFLICKTCFDVTHIFVGYKKYFKNSLNL